MSSPSSSRISAAQIIELQPVHHTLQQHDVQSSINNRSQGRNPFFSILGRIPRKVKGAGRTQVQATETSTLQREDRNESLPSPSVAFEELPRWNYPKINMYRTFATFWSFIVMGANDAAYGVGQTLRLNIEYEVPNKDIGFDSIRTSSSSCGDKFTEF